MAGNLGEPVLSLHHDALGTIVRVHETGLRQRLTEGLVGDPLRTGLLRLPRLLSLCGSAQGQAARNAARGAGVCLAAESSSADTLWREQVLAVAWRQLIDWPRALGERLDLAALKGFRLLAERTDAASDRRLGAGLGRLVPGLPMLDVEAPRCVVTDRVFMNWIHRRDCLAARLLARAIELDRAGQLARTASAKPGAAITAAFSGAVAEAAAGVFAAPSLNHWLRAAGPVELGPNAGEILAEADLSPWVRRLIGQVLQLQQLADGALPSTAACAPQPFSTLADGRGVGMAMTSRGPVFHCLGVDASERVTSWQTLAPTDWHFADAGACVLASRPLALSAEALGLLVLSFDPCCRWVLVPAATEPAPLGVLDA